jgi:hypothetical protein
VIFIGALCGVVLLWIRFVVGGFVLSRRRDPWRFCVCVRVCVSVDESEFDAKTKRKSNARLDQRTHCARERKPRVRPSRLGISANTPRFPLPAWPCRDMRLFALAPRLAFVWNRLECMPSSGV